jgi:uncharacterized protein (UPF0303 family)
MAAQILSFMVSTYAMEIYIQGTNTLTAIPSSYYIPVEEYAATNYTGIQIEQAWSNGWITAQQYQETMSYVPVK